MNTRPDSITSPAYAGFYKVIAPLVMCSGVGDGITTACVMAQAATIDALRKGKTLDEPTDQMECACPLLRRMAIYANDANWWNSDDERTLNLRPLIPLLLDSKVDEETTWKRIFYVVDKVVRELTPMRLEYIGRKEDVENIKTLRSLTPITDKNSARAAAELCQGFKKSAYAYASASASAYADASAYAYAYAYASASASAYADADASADAYAYAYASADAYAYAYASADADADAQKIKYRDAYLALFREVAAIR